MRKLLYFVRIILSNLLSFLNEFIPKDENKILFYTNQSYNDNVMALLLWCTENGYQEKFSLYSCVKISVPDSQKNIFFISRLKGLFVFLKAKYVFYDVGTTRIKPVSTQKVVQIWHGTPLKKIGRVVANTIKNDRFNDFSFIITTSEKFIDIFSEAFECTVDQVKVFEYPRCDYLLKPDRHLFERYQQKTYKKNILWMPTFRNSQYGVSEYRQKKNISLPFFENAEDIGSLNEILKELDFFLTIKLHPAAVENFLSFPNYTNIKVFTNKNFKSLNVPNYSFVACFDALITDYSSIFFDWLLLDRPLAFTVDDISEYREQRGFVFDNPFDYMPGKILQTKSQLYDFFNDIAKDRDGYREMRNEVKRMSHSAKWQGDACKTLLDYLGIAL